MPECICPVPVAWANEEQERLRLLNEATSLSAKEAAQARVVAEAAADDVQPDVVGGLEEKLEA
jgi:hypothetical protein